MLNSIANFKENLNKIATGVHDDDDDDDGEELSSAYNSRDRHVNSLFDRRTSHSFAHSMSPTPTQSPVANGFDSPRNSQIEQYKADIKRLQESEAEIKALSKNYVALLKDKENEISRLHEENGMLKQSLHEMNAALSASRSAKGSDHRSPNKGLVKNRTTGSSPQNGSTSKQDIQSNGIGGSEKELIGLLEEKTRALAGYQATHESEVKQLGVELSKERDKLSNVNLRLEDEQKLNASFQQELNSIRVQKDQLLSELSKVRDELTQKTIEIRQLQMELERRDHDETEKAVEDLKIAISRLEKENSTLKSKNDVLAAALEATWDTSANKHQSESLGESSRREEMELSLQRLEKELKEARRDRDKALQELNRLKQHLLEKESEEADKMDEDRKVIEELQAVNDCQKSQILQLERSLKQALTNHEEHKLLNENEMKKSKEVIDDLNRKLESCMRNIETKNVEVLNLEIALGQYNAEIEAKERLRKDLAAAKEESARLSELLKESYQQAETLRWEKEEVLANLSKTDAMLAEGKNRVTKLEGDNEKLHRVLEQSMTRLNMMSVDSDFLVDRRIVIKLLVTYFQRNHSKEVLDLMVRMLGFSDEDKQRIGLAQQGGKGVVRGVLGLPGRLVGGILGSGSSEAPSNMKPEDQSFADLWVDFLLKETEEREKRESAAGASEEDQNKISSSTTSKIATSSDGTPSIATATSSFGRPNAFSHQNRTIPSNGTNLQSEATESQFSTISLSLSGNSSQFPRFLTRYS